MSETVRKKRGAVKVYSSYEEQRKVHNKRRREKYAADKTHRREILNNSRRIYALRNNVDVKIAVIDESELKKIGTVRNIESGISPVKNNVITFNIEETSKAFGGYNTQVVYRWLRNGAIPEMKNKAYSKGKITTSVYTYDEIKHIVKILNRHQTDTSYYFSMKYKTAYTHIKNAVDRERGLNV